MYCTADENMRAEVVGLGGGNGLFNNKYIIPVYQREYSWTQENITEFCDSIKSVLALGDGAPNLFMGTVQLFKEDEKTVKCDVVDGQQRITTFLLLYSLLFCYGDGGFDFDIIELPYLNRDFLAEYRAAISADIASLDISKERLKDERNIYLRNRAYLKSNLWPIIQRLTPRKVAEILFKKVYFVRITTVKMPLAQVVAIFKSINTTGLDLDGADAFKVSFYDYLNRTASPESNTMERLQGLYNRLKEKGIEPAYAVDLFKYVIAAELELSTEKTRNGSVTFFSEIFRNDSGQYRAALTPDSFEKCVDVLIKYYDFYYKNDSYNGELSIMEHYSAQLIEATRYRYPYWVIPFVALYYCDNLKRSAAITLKLAKLYIHESVVNDKKVNAVHSFSSSLLTLFKEQALTERIVGVIDGRLKESLNSLWKGKDEFIRRWHNNTFENGARSWVLCLLIEMREIISQKIPAEQKFRLIKRNLYSADGQDSYDREHIFPEKYISGLADAEQRQLYNGMGNLVFLERGINRSVQERAEDKDGPEGYAKSRFYGVQYVKGIRDGLKKRNLSWGIEQVQARSERYLGAVLKFIEQDWDFED